MEGIEPTPNRDLSEGPHNSHNSHPSGLGILVSPPWPTVSIIIPVLNESERLARALDAIGGQTYPKTKMQVIVVDNGSTEPIRLPSLPMRTVCVREPIPGVYAARNTGLRHATGRVIAFTDADCIPDPDWVRMGVSALLREPNCGLVAGAIDIFFRRPEHPTTVELLDSLIAFNQAFHVREQHFGATANLFTFRKAFEHVGTFDTSFCYGGDNEWGSRVFTHGYRQVFCPDARVKHPARRSLRQLVRRSQWVIGGRLKLREQKRLPRMSSLRIFVGLARARNRMLLEQLARRGFVSSRTRRVQVLALYYFIRCIQFAEVLRLMAGGAPRW